MEQLDPEIVKGLIEEGYIGAQRIPNRGICALHRMLFTVGIVYGIDATGYKGRYCYHTAGEAAIALLKWNGEGDPSGEWIVHKSSRGNRYREHAQFRNKTR